MTSRIRLISLRNLHSEIIITEIDLNTQYIVVDSTPDKAETVGKECVRKITVKHANALIVIVTAFVANRYVSSKLI